MMAVASSVIANVMTVDVEDYFHVQAFAGVIDRRLWGNYPMRVEQNTRRVLKMFQKYNVRATFFILGWVAERCAKLVREIADAGHEIGCHGYAHQPIYGGDAHAFRQDVRHALAIVENILGSRVQSYRAPSYSITKKTMWALDVLVEEGFEFDSSIFPVLHDNYGIPEAPRFPHVRKLNRSGQITEFPPSTIRLLGNNVPVAGGGYLRLYPYALTSWAIHHLNRQENQPAMVYLHPWELDKAQPRIPAPWRSRFRHYQNLGTMESKLENLLIDFTWKPMGEVLRQTALDVLT
jgi:polysaccharide deacetylase family protein (PEP-CTERM system associated)